MKLDTRNSPATDITKREKLAFQLAEAMLFDCDSFDAGALAESAVNLADAVFDRLHEAPQVDPGIIRKERVMAFDDAMDIVRKFGSPGVTGLILERMQMRRAEIESGKG